MRILVCNDDGIFAKGIQTLAKALEQKGTVTIVAPDRNRSGASNSLTLDAPLRVRRLQPNQIIVEGTPTDCVHLALTGLLDQLPDIIVSGINEGSNLGDDVLYSGTVAAAIEGRFLGLPALAISLAGTDCQYYETAAAVALQLVDRLAKDPLPANTILNVNVPDLPFNQVRGVEVTRLGTRHRAERACEHLDPWGNKVYWIGPAGEAAEAGPGTDFFALKENKVAVTPLHVDLTQYKAFEQVANWLTRLHYL